MRTKIIDIAALLSVGVFLTITGCELEPERCSPSVDPECVETETDTSEDSGTPDADTSTEGQAYHYVFIADREDPDTSSPTHTAGVDIFGVQLNKGGSLINASEVHTCNFGSGDNAHATNCESALGTPVGNCSTSGTADYVALGGAGGELVVSFGALEEIETGDQITVHECGREQNSGATDEEYDAFIGVSVDPNASTWVECLRGASGEGSCTVGSLPFVARN